MMGIAGTLNDPNDYSRVLMNVSAALLFVLRRWMIRIEKYCLSTRNLLLLLSFSIRTVHGTIRDQYQ